jgi:phosphopantothenoylcysteine decarboxylase/phosphopantothenate--cysteine ligase
MANVDDFRWDFGAPLPGDRAVQPTSARLTGRRVALLLSGGIAAYRAPGLVRELRRAGAEVQVLATPTALQFVTADALAWTSLRPVITGLGGEAEHVEHQPDLWLLAPATYSTLNKLAVGIADNAVTASLASALGRLEAGGAPVLVAPTMHGSMWNAILRNSLARLVDLGVRVVPPVGREGKATLPPDDALVSAVVESLAVG